MVLFSLKFDGKPGGPQVGIGSVDSGYEQRLVVRARGLQGGGGWWGK